VSKLTTKSRAAITAGKFAFPAQRKEPLANASHVRNAIARFNQVEGVSDGDRDAAWQRILAAARQFGVQVHEQGWRALHGGHARRPS
jgi:phosphoribosylanthranilate isomerase